MEKLIKRVDEVDAKLARQIKADMEWRKEMLISQELNTKAITDLTESVAGIVTLYETTNNVGKFIKWLAGTIASITVIWILIKDSFTVN
ncbi:MAG: hypothetical protein JKY52_14445 [Flavobacteriales bacterium]|nr:hypothetical protein [Flavobacteriales bacterium]